MSKTVGIDLGHTNSSVSVMEDAGPRIIACSRGKLFTPSVIAFSLRGTRLFGARANAQWFRNPKYTYHSLKRLMGRMFDDPNLQRMIENSVYDIVEGENGAAWVLGPDRAHPPEELISLMLADLRSCAEIYLNEPVTSAVITVPAQFGTAERKATQQAGLIAGFRNIRIVNEPLAAAFAQERAQSKKRLVVVYRLGGGSFDVSILESKFGKIELLGSEGDTFLGGADIDARIAERLRKDFELKHSVDLSSENLALLRIREAAEAAKIALSDHTSHQISLPFLARNNSGAIHLSSELTRSNLEYLVSDLIEDTINSCRKVMTDTGKSISEIDRVIFAGAATNMPGVQDAVAEFFSKTPVEGIDPAEAASLGAAILAGNIEDGHAELALRDVVPLSIGIETLGGVFTRLITRNTPIPTKVLQTFSTAEDNQPAVTINIFQGEREMARDNKKLGSFNLEGIAPAARGVPQIEVTFGVDEDGILSVSARDKATGKAHRISIEEAGGLGEREIDSMREDASAHAIEDQNRRTLVEAINDANSLIHQTARQLAQYGDQSTRNIRDEIERAADSLQRAVQKEVLDEITTGHEALMVAAMKLGETIYNAQLYENVQFEEVRTESGVWLETAASAPNISVFIRTEALYGAPLSLFWPSKQNAHAIAKGFTSILERKGAGVVSLSLYRDEVFEKEEFPHALQAVESSKILAELLRTEHGTTVRGFKLEFLDDDFELTSEHASSVWFGTVNADEENFEAGLALPLAELTTFGKVIIDTVTATHTERVSKMYVRDALRAIKDHVRPTDEHLEMAG